jgi:hypothetical protein
MVDVRMTQDHGVDRHRFERKRLSVACVGGVAALDQAAVEQQGPAADAHDVT